MNTNKEQAIEFIQKNSLTGIRAGFKRPTFLDIWMVVVDDRIFARSWGFAEKSWYHTFLQHPEGEIRCGEQVFRIKAHVPADLDLLTGRINAAYLEKYREPHNIPYAQGIVEEKHAAKTMEFVVAE